MVMKLSEYMIFMIIGLENNIINNKTIDFSNEETYLKAFIQDYMDRIIDKKLNYFNSSE